MTRTTCPVVESFDPLAPPFLADPFAVLAALPRDMPVFYAPSIDYYVITKYADIAEVFRDSVTLGCGGAAAACRVGA